MRREFVFIPVPPQWALTTNARREFDLHTCLGNQVDRIPWVLTRKVSRDPIKVVADVVCRKCGGEVLSDVTSERPMATAEQDAREETLAAVAVERDDGVDVIQEALELSRVGWIDVM